MDHNDVREATLRASEAVHKAKEAVRVARRQLADAYDNLAIARAVHPKVEPDTATVAHDAERPPHGH
jgi:hypothetical protein